MPRRTGRSRLPAVNIDDLRVDLEGLDPAAAREVVAGYLTSARELQRQLQSARDREELWRKRTLQARQAGDQELTQRAETRLQEARAACEKLTAEEFELSVVIDRLKKELSRLQAAPALSGIDADQLLADLRSIAGEPDPTADALKDLQTEQELRALKRRLQGES